MTYEASLDAGVNHNFLDTPVQPLATDFLASVMARADVVVIHETDGRKYLEALVVMAENGEIGSLTFGSASVLWRLAHCLLRERKRPGPALAIALDNLLFRCRVPFLQNKIIVLAIAPWDWRMLFYAVLLPRNRIIYNSSWPWWDGTRVPRHYGALTPWIKSAWHAVLRHPNVTLSAVTRPAATAIAGFLPGRMPRVIPHVVSREFFAPRDRRDKDFKLLFVGELSEKKGFAAFVAILEQLGPEFGAEVIGDGPLHRLAETLATRPGCRWHGRVTDRRLLASVAAECHMFLSPSRKTPKWEELFGMAIVESMALGLVCAVTNHIGPRAFIHHGVNGLLIDQDNAQDFVIWANTLRSDRSRWAEMSQAAAITATEYAMPQVKQQWRELIGGLLAQSPAATPAALLPAA